MFMGSWPCPNWVVPYPLWRIFLSFHDLKWSRFQTLFHCDGALVSCQPWVACWPCVFSALSWFCFAGWFFQLRPGVPSTCWQSERTPACSSFALPSKSVKQVKHSTIDAQTSSARNCKYEIESSLSKCGSFNEHETIWPISIKSYLVTSFLNTHTLLSLTSWNGYFISLHLP